MSDVDCPYCGAEQEICHDDGYGYEEDQVYEQECRSCEKVFAYTTGIILVHTAHRADCLNGSEHRYRPTHTYPVERTRMECQDCGHRRHCTENELLDVIENRSSMA